MYNSILLIELNQIEISTKISPVNPKEIYIVWPLKTFDALVKYFLRAKNSRCKCAIILTSLQI